MAKSFNSLIPSIEAREAAWVKLKERLSVAAPGTERPTVTISREFGCEAFPLAERLKALLEQATGEPWMLYDKALVEKVASDEQMSLELLSHLGDESHAVDVLKTHFGYLTHDQAYHKVVKHLVQIAAAGNAIVVGRGGAVACQDLPNCFHVRLEGSFPFRAATVAQRLDMPLRDAEDMVRTQSKLREKFISECLQTDITQSRWYHAILNNERLGVEAMAVTVLAMMRQAWPHPALFKG